MRLCAVFMLLSVVMSCTRHETSVQDNMQYARLLRVDGDKIVSFSPFDGSEDTLTISSPLGRIVCMSTSHVAYLDALCCDSVICGVSGADYVSSPMLRSRIKGGEVFDVGYDQAPDYERIVSLKPDILLAYKVSGASSPFLDRLGSFGIRVFPLYEFMENHPLGRAEYLKAFGLMTGRSALADSLFSDIVMQYNAFAGEKHDSVRVNVLMNIPYGDSWYIPGDGSYMSRLVEDAGGRILGAAEGTAQSRVISLEEAFVLSKEADCWLNTGWCNDKASLKAANPLFGKFEISKIYNNTRRSDNGKGNDFWESGYVRPHLILRDLKTIMKGVSDGKAATDSLYYYLKVE